MLETGNRGHTFQQLPRKLQHGDDLGAGLPLGVTQHAQTHGPTVRGRVVGDVGVVDLCREGYGGRLEGVVWWEG